MVNIKVVTLKDVVEMVNQFGVIVRTQTEYYDDPSVLPNRVDDIGVYFKNVDEKYNPERVVTLNELTQIVRTYLEDGPVVEDNWGDLDRYTTLIVLGYLVGKYTW